jgi:hypothetical protein
MEFELVSLHLLTLALTAIVILYSDHQGFLYFRGKKQILSKTFLEWSHTLVWIGLLLMITTGVLLTIPSWTYRLQDPIFFVKLGFVLILVVNAFAIGTLARKASETPFAALSKDEQRVLLLSGSLSFSGWVGAFVIGMFFL